MAVSGFQKHPDALDGPYFAHHGANAILRVEFEKVFFVLRDAVVYCGAAF